MKNLINFLFFIVMIVLLTSCNKDEIIENIDSDTFVDSRDGKRYKWVKIGDQIWMAENLAYLPKVFPSHDVTDKAPRYYVYGYEGTNVSKAKATENYSKYGVLYNWNAINQWDSTSNSIPSNVQGIAPEGWHIPSDAEWIQLVEYIIETKGFYGTWENSWYGIGKHLKSTGVLDNGSGLWMNAADSLQGTDFFGFNALPSGFVAHDLNTFLGLNYHCAFWSCSEYKPDERFRWQIDLNFERDDLIRHFGNKAQGSSLRCIKDSTSDIDEPFL